MYIYIRLIVADKDIRFNALKTKKNLSIKKQATTTKRFIIYYYYKKSIV